MTKQNKKIIKRINRNNLEPDTGYQEEGSGKFYITDKNGRFSRFVTEKVAIEHNAKDPMDKEFDKYVESKAKKKKKKGFDDADKNKEQLKKLKEDPEYLRGELDKLYLAYDEKEADLQSYLDKKRMLLEDITEKDPKHAKVRMLQGSLEVSMKKLYDKAKAYSGITGEDEKARAFQYVVGRKFEEELPGNVPTPQFQPNPNVQKKTDEELLRELQQLKQRK